MDEFIAFLIFFRLKESGAINGSLFALGQVVDALNQGLVRNSFSIIYDCSKIGVSVQQLAFLTTLLTSHCSRVFAME